MKCEGLEPSMTGLYVREFAGLAGPRGYEVRFAFEGETWFSDRADAEAALAKYEKILLRVIAEKNAGPEAPTSEPDPRRPLGKVGPRRTGD